MLSWRIAQVLVAIGKTLKHLTIDLSGLSTVESNILGRSVRNHARLPDLTELTLKCTLEGWRKFIPALISACLKGAPTRNGRPQARLRALTLRGWPACNAIPVVRECLTEGDLELHPLAISCSDNLICQVWMKDLPQMFLAVTDLAVYSIAATTRTQSVQARKVSYSIMLRCRHARNLTISTDVCPVLCGPATFDSARRVLGTG